MALPSRMRQVARLTALLLVTGLVVSAPIGTAKGDSAPAAAAKPTAAKVATAAGFDVRRPCAPRPSRRSRLGAPPAR